MYDNDKKAEDLSMYFKNRLIGNYLIENAVEKKEEKLYPVGIALVDIIVALFLWFLPVFIAPSSVDYKVGLLGGVSLSGEESIAISWLMLSGIFIMHLALFLYQYKHHIGFWGFLNIFALVGLVLIFVFQAKLRKPASLLVILTALGYAYWFISYKIAIKKERGKKYPRP